MKFIRTEIPEIIVVEPDIYCDERGFFLETFNARKYAEGGITANFVQDNYSRSSRHTLRGLHAQRRNPQGKLVRVIEGEVFDVAVDIRKGSPTFGRWVAVMLSAESARQCYIPPGFAHGFCVTSEAAQVEYKCTGFYNPSDEIHLMWNDPELGIEWPVNLPTLSHRDRTALTFRELMGWFPQYENAA